MFPELALSGYSIDDLFLQDPLLDARTTRRSTSRRRPAPTCCPSSWSVRRWSSGNRVYNCAVVIHRGEILGIAPKSYLPNYREFYERRWFAPGDDTARASTIDAQRRRGPLRPRPDLLGHRRRRPPPARRDLRGHVGPDPAERGGRARRRDRARQPQRQPDHRRPAPRTAACWCAAPARAATRRTSMRPPARASRPPTSAGTARRWSTSAATCSPRASASPTGRGARPSTSTSTGCARSACGRATSTTTAVVPAATTEFRIVEFALDPPEGDIGLRRKVDRFPFVPDDPERLALDCYEAYNIQVSGLEQRLRGDRCSPRRSSASAAASTRRTR